MTAGVPDTHIVRPNKIQQDWADAEIGVLIHFDMQVYVPEYNWRNYGSHPDASVFNPTELDTDQWLETASKLGAKYAVLVAKHGSGFSLWPTEAHDYSVKNCPWKDGKGDIVADFVASCKKYGIKPGIYANTNANGYLHTDRGITKEGGPVSQVEYNAVVAKQLTELWSNYGELFEIWFDGGVLTPKEGGADVLPLVQKLQPNAIAFQGPYGHENLIRWVGNELGTAPDPCWATADSTTNSDGVLVVDGLNGRPDAPFWCPGESDFTLRRQSSFGGGWMWREGEDDMVYSLDELMEKYETSVGRNTNMLLGLVIDRRGLIPDADVKLVEEYGEAIRKNYGTPFAETKGKGSKVILSLPSSTVVDRVIIQEDISEGERVLVWHLEGVKPDGSTVELCAGTNIGHKRIARFDPVEVSSLQLVIDSYKDEPLIKEFAVFQK
ncbi:MAG: alpha-L-fucosidase [Bacteroidales bacterium]|nr:alpha-L-fucosidase [Bacteroidales bacterium]